MALKHKLNQQIGDAQSHDDLYNILKNVELSEFKAFLKQKVENKQGDNLQKFYYNSQCIIDLFGNDITKECLSYLDIHQLYQIKCVSNSFQAMINQLLSTDTIWINIIKTDPVISDFKEWLQEYMDYPNNYNDCSLGAFYLVEKYDDNFEKLKGKDLMLADCLMTMGCTDYGISTVADNDGENIIEISDGEILRYGEEKNYRMHGIGYLDYSGKGPKIGAYGKDNCGGDYSVLDIYNAMIVSLPDSQHHESVQITKE